MASTNPDSMTNAQGEFQPSRPRDQPLTTSGHQPGREGEFKEFTAEVLPAGSAPASRTFQPNPIDETPGQANNPDADQAYGKESTRTDPLDFPGATSGSVHTGIGHPGSGQTSSELHHDSQNKAAGLAGRAQGGSGLTGDGSAESERLQREHAGGPVSAREHNASLEGAESREPETADRL